MAAVHLNPSISENKCWSRIISLSGRIILFIWIWQETSYLRSLIGLSNATYCSLSPSNCFRQIYSSVSVTLCQVIGSSSTYPMHTENVNLLKKFARMQHSCHHDLADRMSVFYDTAKWEITLTASSPKHLQLPGSTSLPPSFPLSSISLSFPQLVRAAIFTCTALWQTSFK